MAVFFLCDSAGWRELSRGGYLDKGGDNSAALRGFRQRRGGNSECETAGGGGRVPRQPRERT